MSSSHSSLPLPLSLRCLRVCCSPSLLLPFAAAAVCVCVRNRVRCVQSRGDCMMREQFNYPHSIKHTLMFGLFGLPWAIMVPRQSITT